MGDTSIRVSEELADELYDRKERGDTYEDVIWRLIERAEQNDVIATTDSSSDQEISEPTPEPNDPPDVEIWGSPKEDRKYVEQHAADIEFPSSRDRDNCIEAIAAAYAYLKDEESVSMREFVLNVMPAQSVGYDVPDLSPGDRYRGSWWRKIVKPGLQALPDVESPRSGENEWRYSE